MTISLPPALDELLARKMASGLYDNAAEAVREALRQTEARESVVSWLQQEAKVGFDQLDRGEFVEMDRESFMNHFRSRSQTA